MENQGVEQAAQPTLCSGGCGFYSNVGTNGLCSKCYRELQARDKAVAATAQSIAEKAMPQAPSPAPSMPAPAPTTSTPAPPVAEASPSAPAPAPPKSSTRCLTCNKKVGLTGFNCKCNPDAVFCSQHRYAEAHSCTFDYKSSQRQQLATNNPVVQAAKLQKL